MVRNGKRKHESVRFSEDQLTRLASVETATGWTRSKCVQVLVDAGHSAVFPSDANSGLVTATQDLVRAAVAHHEVEKLTAKSLARARGQVRAATRKVKSKR